jgi:hypothetical protein
MRRSSSYCGPRANRNRAARARGSPETGQTHDENRKPAATSLTFVLPVHGAGSQFRDQLERNVTGRRAREIRNVYGPCGSLRAVMPNRNWRRRRHCDLASGPLCIRASANRREYHGSTSPRGSRPPGPIAMPVALSRRATAQPAAQHGSIHMPPLRTGKQGSGQEASARRTRPLLKKERPITTH